MHTKNKPHIVLLNRSFWPDIEATGQFLTELCVGLSEVYKVTVICGRSYYMREKDFKQFRLYRKEKLGGIQIIRVRHTRFWKKSLFGRIINWLTFSLGAFIAAVRTRPDMFIVCTDPPFLGFVVMLAGKLKSVPFIYNCRDLYPDVAWGLGRLSRYNPVGCAFDFINRQVMRSAIMVICLGESMRNKILKKGIKPERVMIISDWADVSKIKPVPKKENTFLKTFGLKDEFIIMHSGNIGLSQNFDLILKALKKVKDKDSFRMLFVGEGAAKERLQERVRRLDVQNILFFPYQPREELASSLSLPDMHIVSLKKGMSGAVVPSKIYAILAAGKPYLAVAEEDCEAVSLVKEYGCGLWAHPDDIDGMTRSIEWAMQHPEELKEMGRRARQIAENKFDKNIIMNDWFKTLEGVISR